MAWPDLLKEGFLTKSTVNSLQVTIEYHVYWTIKIYWRTLYMFLSYKFNPDWLEVKIIA